MFLSVRLTEPFWADPCKWAKAPARLLWPRHLLQAGSRLPGCPLPAGARWPAATSSKQQGLAEETLARLSGCAWGRGAAVPLYIWGRCPRDVRPGASPRRGVGEGSCCEQKEAAPRSAAGNLWARRRAAVLAQLREDCAAPPGPASARRPRRRPLPPPPPPPPPLDLRALSMPGAGARRLPAPRGRVAPGSQRAERGEARAGGSDPHGNPGWVGVCERGQTGGGGKGWRAGLPGEKTTAP